MLIELMPWIALGVGIAALTLAIWNREGYVRGYSAGFADGIAAAERVDAEGWAESKL